MPHQESQYRLQWARRTALAVMAITMAMAGTKAIVGFLSGSSALLADALHSCTDMVALAASWFGLFLAAREPTERFPFGFYRAETLGAAVASGAIIYLGIKFLRQGAVKLLQPVAIAYSELALLTAAGSAVLAYVLYRWEKRVSRATGSQSLSATAEEVRLDMGSSAAVFAALFCARYRVPYVEGIVTLGISALVLCVGFKNLWVAVLSLMDASLDPSLEEEARRIVEALPGVKQVEKIRARKSGPFYFVEGHISVSGSMDVTRSHTIAHEAQRLVQENRPEVEGVVLHVEPYRSDSRRVLVPVDSEAGISALVARHFGRARFFVIATLQGGEVTESSTVENIMRGKQVRAGLGAIREFVEEAELDAVICREMGEIAFHTLRDRYLEVYRCSEQSAADALKAYANGRLQMLSEPTHSSEQKLENASS